MDNQNNDAPPPSTPLGVFQAHARYCPVCWSTPWKLCEVGERMREAAAAAAEPAPSDEPEAFEAVIGPEDRDIFARTLKSVLNSRTKAVGAVDGSILRALLDTLEGRRDSK